MGVGRQGLGIGAGGAWAEARLRAERAQRVDGLRAEVGTLGDQPLVLLLIGREPKEVKRLQQHDDAALRVVELPLRERCRGAWHRRETNAAARLKDAGAIDDEARGAKAAVQRTPKRHPEAQTRAEAFAL
eukprot:3635700-Prymnesium_polylepis.2